VYTVWAVVAVVVVVGVELLWARTGLFRRRAYWVTIAITWAFQVPVDGWLTKLSAPIVIYNPRELSGVRFPWDIPIEDFAYGFALVTLVLIGWLRDADRPPASGPSAGPAAPPDEK
jgi:lycopene cyclase domain-containing protein